MICERCKQWDFGKGKMCLSCYILNDFKVDE